MKLLLFALLVAPLISTFAESAVLRSSILGPHNLFECDPSKPRVKVLQKIVQKPGRARTIVNQTFQYPKIADMFSTKTISCITVEDLSRNGKGGYAEIVAGGLNYNFVTIDFDSQPGEDILFSVTIYESLHFNVSEGKPE